MPNPQICWLVNGHQRVNHEQRSAGIFVFFLFRFWANNSYNTQFIALGGNVEVEHNSSEIIVPDAVTLVQVRGMDTWRPNE